MAKPGINLKARYREVSGRTQKGVIVTVASNSAQPKAGDCSDKNTEKPKEKM